MIPLDLPLHAVYRDPLRRQQPLEGLVALQGRHHIGDSLVDQLPYLLDVRGRGGAYLPLRLPDRVHDLVAQLLAQLLPGLCKVLFAACFTVGIQPGDLPGAAVILVQLRRKLRHFEAFLHQLVHPGLVVRGQIGIAQAALGRDIPDQLAEPLGQIPQGGAFIEPGQIQRLFRIGFPAHGLDGGAQGPDPLPLLLLFFPDLLPVDVPGKGRPDVFRLGVPQRLGDIFLPGPV